MFDYRPYYKQALGWPQREGIDAEKFPLLRCLNDFVLVPDLLPMGQICGDAGVNISYPIGSIAIERTLFNQSLMIVKERDVDIPGFVEEGINVYLVDPTKGNGQTNRATLSFITPHLHM